MKGYFYIVALSIVIHHYIKHREDENMTTVEKIVQIDDINNHETWALFFIGIAIGLSIK